MHIISLKFSNLGSLRGEFELNWKEEPLRSARLFAITGPTGAGKSTILDALTLALYGQTPRLRNQPEAIVSNGYKTGWAEICYSVRGELYCSRWSLRKRKQSLVKMQLEKLGDNSEILGDKVRDVIKCNTQILGLGFERFCRTTLLAQGDFAAFLSAAAKDKASILEALTGTQVYSDLSLLARERFKSVNAELELLSSQKKHVRNELNNFVGSLQKKQIKVIQGKIKKSTIKLKRLQLRHNQLSNILESRNFRNGLQNEITTLEKKLEVNQQLYLQLGQRLQQLKGLENVTEEIRKIKEDHLLFKAVKQKGEILKREISKALTNCEIKRLELDNLNQLCEQLISKKEALKLLLQQDQALVVRARLETGKACPVCLQDVHTLPRSIDSREAFNNQQYLTITNELLDLDQKKQLASQTFQKQSWDLQQWQEQQKSNLQENLDLKQSLSLREEELSKQGFDVGSFDTSVRELHDLRKKQQKLEVDLAATASKLEVKSQQLQQLELHDEKDEKLDESLREVQQKVLTCERDLQNWQHESGRFSLQQKNFKRLLQRFQNLEKQVGEKKRSLRPLALLDRLIGSYDGQKFRVYAQNLNFHQLLYYANQNLKNFAKRYLLVADQEQPFQMRVLDKVGDSTTRSLQTLSGGESFLVSLSLALGLSDMARGQVEIATLFLDEGFGSLDKDTLELTLSALERLSRERRIGIISHVELMKQRIDTCVEVKKGPLGQGEIILKRHVAT